MDENTANDIGFFEYVFQKQKEFQRIAKRPVDNLTYEEKEVLGKDFILALHSELSEVLNEFHWKGWKDRSIVYTEQQLKNLQVELIDVFIFWVDLCLVWELTPRKIVELYLEKHRINTERQQQRKDNK